MPYVMNFWCKSCGKDVRSLMYVEFAILPDGSEIPLSHPSEGFALMALANKYPGQNVKSVIKEAWVCPPCSKVVYSADPAPGICPACGYKLVTLNGWYDTRCSCGSMASIFPLCIC